MAEQFHFLHPAWLWALLPLAGLLHYLWRRPDVDNPWRRVLAPHLQRLLLGQASGSDGRRRRRWLFLLSAGWLLAVLALADPVWDQAPGPVFQSRSARVVVLDLSRSMAARDVKPDRLTRARFKVEDMLRFAGEGQTGLVVFAGDAFTVTPLTRDAATLRSQLHALEPDIMPVQGSRADLGLRQAGELLRQAGLAQGQVLLIADGVEGGQAAAVAAELRHDGYRVAVLGVGTPAGAPLTDAAGRVLRDDKGRVVMPGLEQDALRAVAAAGGGPYASISNGDRDVRALLAAGSAGERDASGTESAAVPQWKERGPWLVLALLPLAALAFRRGWLFSVALLAVSVVPAPPAVAAGAGNTGSAWQDLWQRPEQQAARALAQGDFGRASALAGEPLRRGAAHYKQGDYGAALADFEQASGAEASYNRGNALARLGRYEDAVAAYTDALQGQPEMADALANKAAVEALLEQQRRQNEQQQQAGHPDQQGQEGQPGRQGQQGQQDQQAQAAQASLDGQAAASRQATESRPEQAGGAKPQSTDRESRDAAGPKNAGAGSADAQDKAEGRAQVPGAAAAKPQDKQTVQSPRGQEKGANQFRAALEDFARREPDAAGTDGADAAAPGRAGPVTAAGRGSGAAKALNNEERIAAEQWLRRIPDDPGGLLRRKFLYQYQQRQGAADAGGRQGW